MTLADEDTNSISTVETNSIIGNMAILGNVTMQAAVPGGQLFYCFQSEGALFAFSSACALYSVHPADLTFARLNNQQYSPVSTGETRVLHPILTLN